jgi:hypothetical protein
MVWKRASTVSAFALIAALSGCGSSSHPTPTRALSAASPTAPAHRARLHPASLRARVRRSALLPQTRVFPSSDSGEFRALMAALWSGVLADSPARAAVAFFPREAYVQLKAIGEAGVDWENRLFRDYTLDISAAHALLGPGAASARLLGVSVSTSYGHWVEPGVCANSVGYYEMPNARVVYTENGATRSFGIASMISWRGVWYVVHLGAVLREGDAGTVDEPASGAGSSAYSGTC